MIKFGIFTNTAYDICGFIVSGRVRGFITKTSYPYIYRKFQWVNLPEYHLDINDIEVNYDTHESTIKSLLLPQFYKKV